MSLIELTVVILLFTKKRSIVDSLLRFNRSVPETGIESILIIFT